jgi:hypothetical protein
MKVGIDIFVYTGGNQDVPFDVTNVRIDQSVNVIPSRAFFGRRCLVSVDTHDGIDKVETSAFQGCRSLRGIKLPGVREIEYAAFNYCTAMTSVEFSAKLVTIGGFAFHGTSLRKIRMPSIRTVELSAFRYCKQLTDLELSGDLESINPYAFIRCTSLRRIAIPLKDDMFLLSTEQRYSQFDQCENLITVDLVGGIHKTISSLLLESWKDEMKQEIDRINHVLPHTDSYEKTAEIWGWIRSVIDRMEHYKDEHNTLLEENMTQLELAVWKAKLDEKEGDNSIKEWSKSDTADARNERRIMSGARIVINNVLPFLQLG